MQDLIRVGSWLPEWAAAADVGAGGGVRPCLEAVGEAGGVGVAFDMEDEEAAQHRLWEKA